MSAADSTVLYGADGFRGACLEHDWLCPTLRTTYAVAAADYLGHLRAAHAWELPCLVPLGGRGGQPCGQPVRHVVHDWHRRSNADQRYSVCCVHAPGPRHTAADHDQPAGPPALVAV